MTPSDFPFRPGMLATWTHPQTGTVDPRRWRVISVGEDNLPLRVVDAGREGHALDVWGLAGSPGAASMFAPDLTDGPTKGALLEAVREAYGDPTAYAMPEGNEWVVWAHIPGDDTPGKDGVGDGPTEGAALLAAWEARPR